ncbi:hypothetical protein [Flammeovirga aprica]|uniref:Uncharacterized protein n=1 Tax=Flammeovirga aprica JL-4 TaxID=694437 RepID=A0A7X9P346_9BACT|nr:hypothetical protein [Flammeovirga aprica]NME68465.1 hypothetical protein [Flammeovirga aprica JL-4]
MIIKVINTIVLCLVVTLTVNAQLLEVDKTEGNTKTQITQECSIIENENIAYISFSKVSDNNKTECQLKISISSQDGDESYDAGTEFVLHLEDGSEIRITNLEDVEYEYDMNQFICMINHKLQEEDLKKLQNNKIVDIKGYNLDGAVDQMASLKIQESVRLII